MHRLFVYSHFKLITSFFVLSLLGCDDEPSEVLTKSTLYFCSAEHRIMDGADPIYNDGYGRFIASAEQSDEFAFDGKYSCKIDSTAPYGMPIKFTDVEVGEFFEASIWIKQPVNETTLIAGISGNTNYSLNTNATSKIADSNGWSNYYLSLGIETKIDTLVFFTFTPSTAAYVDNFKIIRHKERPAMPYSAENTLKIFIPDSQMQALNTYKTKALQQDIISSDLKKYVNGFILQKNDSIPIEIRLKGDWTDHLENGKTSYRIKTDLAYKGLSSFSIQHPSTRNYMHEWFMHKVCEIEGVLTTTYDFLPVQINGKTEGIYALEEHFDKQLLESRNFREGPILKIDESGFWGLLAHHKKDAIDGSYPYFESALITCFKAGRTSKSDVLSNQFINAASLLTLFKQSYNKPEQLFDLKRAAKFYALMDMGNIHHALAWHNRRFYYNPVTAKLEYIAYDMIPAILPLNSLKGQRELNLIGETAPAELLIDFKLFSNAEFRNYYINYCKKYSSINYLDSVFSLLNDDIVAREKLLSFEFPNYKLNREFYYEKASFSRKELESLENKWDSVMNKPINKSPKKSVGKYIEPNEPFLLEEISANIYVEEIDTTNYIIRFENFHLSELTVLGYTTKQNKELPHFLPKPIKLSKYTGVNLATFEMSLAEKPNKFLFAVANCPNEVFTKKVFNWPKPMLTHPRIELENKFSAKHSLYKIQNGLLTIAAGNYTLNELIYVPSHYQIIIEAGTTIDIINKGGLIFNNNVSMLGTSVSPIKIISSDTSSQGITILNAEKVNVAFTELYNQKMLDYKGWKLTGAFTIYEGDVSINHLKIDGNNCEDALNIIRANFNISQLEISNTKSDGFDADFCTGKITDSKFENTGNDCIDFSGSIVDISKITIRNSGDKGISSGERSNLNVSEIDIDGALTGLASKDGSILTAKNITAKNCQVGVALFRKKPEYEYSKLNLSEANFEKINTLCLIEKGASLIYNGVYYFGTSTFNIEAMYAQWEK